MRTIYIVVALKRLHAIMKYSILCRFRYEIYEGFFKYKVGYASTTNKNSKVI
jgi:hypothetical protein